MTTTQVYPLVPEGEYKAACVKLNPPQKIYGARWSMRAEFALHGTGEVLNMYFSLGVGAKPNMDPTSKLYKLWSVLYGQKPADGSIDFARLTDSRVVYTVKVETATNKTKGYDYSKVTDILKVLPPKIDAAVTAG